MLARRNVDTQCDNVCIHSTLIVYTHLPLYIHNVLIVYIHCALCIYIACECIHYAHIVPTPTITASASWQDVVTRLVAEDDPGWMQIMDEEVKKGKDAFYRTARLRSTAALAEISMQQAPTLKAMYALHAEQPHRTPRPTHGSSPSFNRPTLLFAVGTPFRNS